MSQKNMSTFFFVILVFVAHATQNKEKSKNLSFDKNSATASSSCQAGIGFMTTPYNGCFTVNSLTSVNTGVIPGLPSCWEPKWILGSVVTKSYNKDHTNYLLGDSQDIGYMSNANVQMTWFNADTTYVPTIAFGPKLIAVTNQGDNDGVITYHGAWKFVMIPLKSDMSFDIIPNGQNPGTVDKICFNLIAFA